MTLQFGRAPHGRDMSWPQHTFMALLNDADRNKVLKLAEPVTVQANAAVLRQGDPIDHVFLVDRGHVRMHRAALADGPEMLLDIIGAGDIIGLEDFVAVGRSHATYVCGPKPAAVWAIPTVEFGRLRLERVALRTVSIKLRNRGAALALAPHPVRNRVIMFLCWLAGAHGRPVEGSDTVMIDVGFTQADIAAAVGAAPAQVRAVLATLGKRGYIANGYRSVRILRDLRKAVVELTPQGWVSAGVAAGKPLVAR